MSSRDASPTDANGALGRLKRGWMAFAHALGAFNAAILMALAYFLVLGPIATLSRLGSADPLTLRSDDSPSWTEENDPNRDLLQRAQRQF